MDDVKHIAARHGRMLEMAILEGNRLLADTIASRAFEEIANIDKVTIETRLDSLLPHKTATHLVRVGILNVGDITKYTRVSLLVVSNLRSTTVDNIDAILTRHGFGFAAEI